MLEPMSPGRPRSDNPFNGDPLADPSLEKPLSALRALAGSQFEVLGPLGRDAEGEYAFLAREVSRKRLVVLKRRRSALQRTADPGTLQVITQLDSSVPPPAGSCPVCQAPFSNWEPSCPECGANAAGTLAAAPGTPPEKVLAAVRQAAEGYEVFGTMHRAVGGAPVHFARDLSGGHLVALRLEDEGGSGGPGYTITATRMMRPKLLYGTIGGEASRDSGIAPRPPEMWTPTPSPARAIPIAGNFAGSLEGSLPGGKICPQCNQTFGSELRLCPRDGTALRPVAIPDPLIGRIIADRYHIVDRLGQGGMGTVYLAEHVRMGRRCAVKVMNSALLNDPDSLDRFTREAKNASLLNHPHVAAIYDFGEAADGIVYLAMEFVEGESLAAVLDRKEGLPERQALELASQVADALGAAHELGIVHRDLKPDNIMVCHSKSGKLRVKVVDFGIAKATQGGHQTVTRTGYVVGTPAYMSPEQILGDPLDGRSDLYSLGCILFEMLTGQRAFTGPSGEVSIRRRLTEPPPRPRSVKHALSKALDEIVAKSMARAPEQRFQSAAELRQALQEVLEEGPRSQRGKRHGWLPWSQSQTPEEVEEEPLVTRTPETFTRARLLSPVPFAASPQPDNAPDLSLASDWSSPAHSGTRLRHRSARSEGSHIGRMVGGLVGVALLTVAIGYIVTSGSLSHYQAALGGLVRSILPTKTPTTKLPQPAEPLPLPPEESTATPAPPAPSVDQPTTPATATIRFEKLVPADARVTVDSIQLRPSAEGILTIPPGSHVIVVRASGYRKLTKTVSPAAGDTTSLAIELVRLQPKPPSEETPVADTAMGAIVVKGSLPLGAEVRVDGKIATPASGVLTVTPGSHWVSISVPGYEADSSAVDVEQGSWSDWSVPALTPSTSPAADAVPDSALPPAAGVPSAAAPPGADSVPQPR